MTVTIDLFEQHDDTMIFTALFPWTVAEWCAALHESSQLGKQYPVRYVLFDTRLANKIPSDFLSSLQTMRNNYQPNIQHRVLIGANPFVKSMYKIVGVVNPDLVQSFAMVETLEEVRALLEKWRLAS